jgi:hypothetical protein
MPKCSNCGRENPHEVNFCNWCRLEYTRKSETDAIKYSFVSLGLCLVLFLIQARLIFLILSIGCLIGLVMLYYKSREKEKELERILNLT